MIRDLRGGFSPYGRDWQDREELQRATDVHVERLSGRWLSPATGQSVAASLALERPYLATLPLFPEPFDIAVSRTVAWTPRSASSSVDTPSRFAFIGRRVEIRGAAGRVQVLTDSRHRCASAPYPGTHSDRSGTSRGAVPPSTL